MSQSTSYAALSQTELGDGKENKQNSLAETSDEFTSSSQDSLDLVLLEIGNKRKVRRKKRRKMGGIQKFDGAESYEVSEPNRLCHFCVAENRFTTSDITCHVSFAFKYLADIKRHIIS